MPRRLFGFRRAAVAHGPAKKTGRATDFRGFGTEKVSKKCPSSPSRAWDEPPIYEGAGSRIRTDDLLITNQLLYQLSYAGIYEGK
jgi:hypothetical protein